jgi:ABC-type multidrug transport system ATPase subunit
LREVTSTCNLLILDEPGEGLDASNAKAFAVALREAAKRFGTVMVTTHNAYITAELSAERSVVIAKRNGISEVQTV